MYSSVLEPTGTLCVVLFVVSEIKLRHCHTHFQRYSDVLAITVKSRRMQHSADALRVLCALIGLPSLPWWKTLRDVAVGRLRILNSRNRKDVYLTVHKAGSKKLLTFPRMSGCCEVLS